MNTALLSNKSGNRVFEIISFTLAVIALTQLIIQAENKLLYGLQFASFTAISIGFNMRIHFFEHHFIIKSVLGKKQFSYRDIERVVVNKHNKYGQVSIQMRLKNGKKYPVTNDIKWAEDLCNLMHKQGVEIEIKSPKYFQFKNGEYHTSTPYPRNEKEMERKLLISEFNL